MLLSNLVKKDIGVLLGILQNQVALDTMAIFIMFILPNHEHWRSFHLLVSP